MSETVELLETRIVPVEKDGHLIVCAPNGQMIRAPFEVWLAALLGRLPDAQASELCARVAQMVLEHNNRPGQIIDPRQSSAFDCIRSS